MDYIKKLDLQTEEVKEVENLEKHVIVNNKPFTVDEYEGHDRDFLAVDGEYDDGFKQLKETNGLGISCNVSKEVKDAREDVNGVYHEKLKDRIDIEVNNLKSSLDNNTICLNDIGVNIKMFKNGNNTDSEAIDIAIQYLKENGGGT